MPQISIKSADGGEFSAYLAPSRAGSGPGILVIQEIFGVNKVMRDICDDYASIGFTAICPDLFWRQAPGVDITDQSQAEWDKAFSLFQGFNETRGVEDLIATLEVLRGHEACTGKVGATGYCLGGKLTYLMATRSDADACAGYYGVGIEKALDEAGAITRPLILHVAEEDGFVPKEAQDQIKAALADNPHVTIYSYPGVDHAFARVGGEHYNTDAAGLANQRTGEFFRKHLG